MAKVVVVGSCMIDLICYSPRLPKHGETIHGTSFRRDFGGKGANQCIAATRLGAQTALVACLGADTFGKEYLNHLQTNNVDTRHISLVEGQSCGIAQITVADNGENQIIIIAGANNCLDYDKIGKASQQLSQAAVIVFQFETPVATTLKALKHCKDSNPSGITIVNAAPAISLVDSDMYKYTDILCVNETEAQLLTGLTTCTIAEAEVALKHLLTLGWSTVIITLGGDGAIFGSAKLETVHHEPGTFIANPVDTTGAGDAFIGSLAYLMAYRPHWSLARQVKASCCVSAQSIMKRGTQGSFPLLSELPLAWLSD